VLLKYPVKFDKMHVNLFQCLREHNASVQNPSV